MDSTEPAGPMRLARLVYGAMPGGLPGGVSLHIRDDEGPVATKTRDGSYHVAYVRLAHDPGATEGDATEGCEPREAPEVRVLYQETFSDPFRAGAEFQELVAYAPKLVLPDGGHEHRPDSLEELLRLKREIEEETTRWLVEDSDDDMKALGLKE